MAERSDPSSGDSPERREPPSPSAQRAFGSDGPPWAGVLLPADLRDELCELAVLARVLEPDVRRLAQRAKVAAKRCNDLVVAADMPDEAYEAHRLVDGSAAFHDAIDALCEHLAALQ